MIRSVLYRLLGAIPVLLLIMFGIFLLLRLAPGDAAIMMASENATPAEIAALRSKWGLDLPVVIQFFYFLLNALRLDFGVSFRYAEPVVNLIATRLPATIELAGIALLIAVVAAVPLGVVTAIKKGKLADTLGSLFAVAGVSAPHFWVGILLVLFFSEYINLLPSGGRLPYGAAVKTQTGFLLLDCLIQGQFTTLKLALLHLVLPALTLALGMFGIIARISRSAVIDVGQEEFVFTAVAKGLNRGEIVRRHLMPNAAIPIVTIIGLELGSLISGSIIVEVVFSWPGLGSLLFQAVSVRDVPLTVGIVMVYTTLFVLLNIAVDLFYMVIDPRLRAGGVR
jgi:ABC-type dipeptide/oligopeptide/nickel transport system permease component